MGRFYFKIQDQDDVIQPDRGFEFPGVEEAKNEAKFLLAKMAVDGLPKAVIDSLSVELQDENRLPLLTVRLVLEVFLMDQTRLETPGFRHREAHTRARCIDRRRASDTSVLGRS